MSYTMTNSIKLVRQAFERAMALVHDRDAAVRATAQNLDLPVDVVRQAVEGAEA